MWPCLLNRPSPFVRLTDLLNVRKNRIGYKWVSTSMQPLHCNKEIIQKTKCKPFTGQNFWQAPFPIHANTNKPTPMKIFPNPKQRSSPLSSRRVIYGYKISLFRKISKSKPTWVPPLSSARVQAVQERPLPLTHESFEVQFNCCENLWMSWKVFVALWVINLR